MTIMAKTGIISPEVEAEAVNKSLKPEKQMSAGQKISQYKDHLKSNISVLKLELEEMKMLYEMANYKYNYNKLVKVIKDEHDATVSASGMTAVPKDESKDTDIEG